MALRQVYLRHILSNRHEIRHLRQEQSSGQSKASSQVRLGQQKAPTASTLALAFPSTARLRCASEVGPVCMLLINMRTHFLRVKVLLRGEL